MDNGRRGFFFLPISFLPIFFLFIFEWISTCSCSIRRTSIPTGFKATQMDYIDNEGLILYSNSSEFFFGFQTLDSTHTTAFLLVVIHKPSSRVVWTANRGVPVSGGDKLVFGEDGNAELFSGDTVVWSTNTTGSGAASSIQLLDSGNLVVLGGKGGDPVWQSFNFPTDTLLPGQSFREGMDLVSSPNGKNLTFKLKITSGDMILEANFRPPQPYWAISKDTRRIDNVASVAGAVFSADIVNNSWNLFDRKNSLLSQLIISPTNTNGSRWTAVLNSDGSISFFDISAVSGNGGGSNQAKIPTDVCGTPDTCEPYNICSGTSNVRCNCLSSLGCNPDVMSSCGGSGGGGDTELVEVTDKVEYFATGFIPATANGANLTTCRGLCSTNCSCKGLFFETSTGNCFLFEEISSLKQSAKKNFAFYLKVSSGTGGQIGERSGSSGPQKNMGVIISMTILSIAVVAAIVFVAVKIHRRKIAASEPSERLVSSDEDNFLETISGMPVRYSYRELQEATDNFSVKLGQGGFGSVYQGKLPDGTKIAVKKLEGIGQGKKEFRAEVTIIGSIHHVHLVRLRGFCAEGTHRLLAYEFMSNGSLDKWIFKKNRDDDFLLDWDKRFNIAVGTAKGLAYLHEDCDSKIVHCDIKPENVLLDDNFQAKVSDFGLAKLMTREQSHVFTTMRGTRGYLAPEWIINSAISEKSDVYSYGMVLLEIIGGRKNFDSSLTSDKAHFPSYTFKKMEEGNLREVIDVRLKDSDERAETAIKVALWCIQEDMSLRPSMTRVVQMLDGIADVPQPPASSQMGFRLMPICSRLSVKKEGFRRGKRRRRAVAIATLISPPSDFQGHDERGVGFGFFTECGSGSGIESSHFRLHLSNS